jgi:hypothetical protein
MTMESWKLVVREGFFPGLSTKALEGVLPLLKANDPRLCQESTTEPAPLMCVQDWPVKAACFLGLCGWAERDFQETTVGDIEGFFATQCFQADQRLGEPAGCRWFLNWHDDSPRDRMLLELVGEVEAELARRKAA